MKRTKIFSTLLISLIMLLCFSGAAIADNSNVDAQDAYDWLLEIGTPADILDNRSDEVLVNLYNRLVEYDEVSVDVDKVSLTESNPYIQPLGSIDRNDLDFTISTYIGKSRFGNIETVVVTIDYEWADRKPLWRIVDGITVNWPGQYFTYEANSFYAQNHLGSGQQEKITTPDEVVQGGLGWTFDVANSSTQSAYGYGEFTLNPVDGTMISGSRYTANINATYGHKTFVGNVSIGITGSGVSAGVTLVGVDDQTSASTNVRFDFE